MRRNFTIYYRTLQFQAPLLNRCADRSINGAHYGFLRLITRYIMEIGRGQCHSWTGAVCVTGFVPEHA